MSDHRIHRPLAPAPASLFALAAVAATLAVRLALAGSLLGQPTVVIFTVPIMLSAYLGGFYPGVLATIVSYIAVSYYLLPPIHSLIVVSGAKLWQQFFLVLAGIVISGLNEALHRARRQADVAIERHQRAELALQRSEGRYRAMVEWLPEAVLVHRQERVLFANAAAVRLFGAPSAQNLTSRTVRDLVSPAAEPSIGNGSAPASAEGERLLAVESVTRLDGVHLDVDVQSRAIDYDDAPAVLTLMRDVTERKEIEMALRESEARYRRLFEYAPDGILIADRQSYYIDANASICRMLGYTREELVGLHGSAIVAAAEVPNIEPALEEIDAQSTHSREWTFRRKDGSTFRADVNVTDMPDRTLLAIVHDITERVEAAEAVRKVTELMTAIVDSTSDGIVSKDLDGQITSWNGAAARTFGYSAAEIVGQSIRRLIPDHLQQEEDTLLARIRRGERVESYESVRRRKDGTLIPVSLTVSPIRNVRGEVVGASKIVRDISELRKAEDERRRLVALAQVKSEFLANMSHELRTPLNAIIGFTQLMHRGKVGQVSADQHEYLGDILSSSNHLLQLINDILDLAKVESGKIEFRPEPVDLSKLARESCAILRGLAATGRLRMETFVDPDVEQVVVDPSRVKQILYNYLSNAIKFTPPGGRVDLRMVPEGPDWFRIEVEDSGIGIAPGDLGRLFVEFQQLDVSIAKRYQGTGLGLALTKKMAEAQGGHVAVRSTPGAGSTFSVVLPRRMSKALVDELAVPFS